MTAEPTELYRRYRPARLSEVRGQTAAVRALEARIKRRDVPQAVLASGPSGTGKTTICRILAHDVLGVAESDFFEVNCADVRGIDNIREIRQRMGLAGFSGGRRAWLIDEAHRLTPEAQDAFLKMLEDVPAHVNFMLATTDPAKLKPTVRNRCHHIELKPVPAATLAELVRGVVTEEGGRVAEKVVTAIAAAADGSPRMALVLLGAVIGLDATDEQLAAIPAAMGEASPAFDLVRVLIPFKGGSPAWPAVAAVLERIADEEPEGVRHLLLATARKALLDAKNPGRWPAAFAVIDAMRAPFFDRNSGAALLAAGCYDALAMMKKK